MAAVRAFAGDGVCVFPAIVQPSDVRRLQGLPELSSAGKPGSRGFSLVPGIADFVGPHGVLGRMAAGLMGVPVRPVRVLFFDKTPDVNWAVPWHQDRTIAVAHRIETPGFGAWSVKAGVHHVEPPEATLRAIVSLRLHLDDCGAANGPLMALRGSYKLGRVPVGQIRRYIDSGSIEVLCAKAGEVIAMRGLTIHASERAARPGHRRVLHVDFSAAGLPGDLQWAWDSADGKPDIRIYSVSLGGSDT